MSVSTEIQRLQQAKNDIKTAIESKGITVGDGTLDTYAEKIIEIAGGGNSSVSSQEFEITSSVSNAKQLYDIVFTNIPKNHIAVAYLAKDKSEYIYNQIPLLVFGIGNGIAVRNRDGLFNSFIVAENYDAAVDSSDRYRVFDLGEVQGGN